MEKKQVMALMEKQLDAGEHLARCEEAVVNARDAVGLAVAERDRASMVYRTAYEETNKASAALYRGKVTKEAESSDQAIGKG